MEICRHGAVHHSRRDALTHVQHPLHPNGAAAPAVGEGHQLPGTPLHGARDAGGDRGSGTHVITHLAAGIFANTGHHPDAISLPCANPAGGGAFANHLRFDHGDRRLGWDGRQQLLHAPIQEMEWRLPAGVAATGRREAGVGAGEVSAGVNQKRHRNHDNVLIKWRGFNFQAPPLGGTMKPTAKIPSPASL